VLHRLGGPLESEQHDRQILPREAIPRLEANTQGWVDPQRKMIYVLMIQRTGFGNADGSDIRGELHKLAVESLGK
jgi:hypothetical protein